MKKRCGYQVAVYSSLTCQIKLAECFKI